MRRSPSRVLVLSQYYRPEPNFITADVAELCSQHAHVTVVTGHPNYPSGSFPPGTRWWKPVRSVENNVVVWRVPLIPNHSNSILHRAVCYLSFLVMATLIAPFVAGRPAIVWVYHTPFTTALAALWFKFAYGSKLVFTVTDLWPESFSAAGVANSGFLMRAMYRYRRWINRQADRLVCVTQGTLETFAREGIDPDRLVHIPVWVDGIDLQPAPDHESASPPLSIVYSGNLGPAQSLSTIVLAAAILEREGTRVRFDLFGSGTSEEELRALVEQEGCTNVVFHGRVPPAESFRVSRDAFAQIVCLRRNDLFRMTIPSKLMFCFAAGAPILYGLEGEAAEIASRSGGAIRFQVDDPATLAAAVRQLIAIPVTERNGMRSRLWHYYRSRFDRKALLDQYRCLFADLDTAWSVPIPTLRSGDHGQPLHAS